MEHRGNHPLVHLFFANDGTLYGYRLNDLYIIDVVTGLATLVGSGPNSNFSDGCSCPYSIDLEKAVEPASACLGDTITYRFTTRNLSLTTVDSVDFADVFDNNLTIIAVNLALGGTITNGGVGTNVLEISNMTVPEDSASFIVQVVVNGGAGSVASNQALRDRWRK